MFWNRKGKKKGAGDGGADASATAVDDPKTDDLAESAADSDSDNAAKDTAAAAEPAADVKDAEAKDADAEQDADADAKDTGAEDTEAKDGAKAADVEDTDVEAAAANDAEAKGTDAEMADAKGAAAEQDEEDADSEQDADAKKADVTKADAKKGDAKKGDAKKADAKKSDATKVDDDAEAEDADAEQDDEDEDDAAAAESDDEPAEPAGPVEPGTTKVDAEGVQCVRTAGVLKFEDEEYEVVSNTWIIEADKDGVIVIDPAHDAEAVLEAVGDREVHLIACTNGYNTHIQAAVEIAAETEAPIALHRRELRAWRKVHGVEHNPDMEIEGGGSLTVGDLEVDILATPGTSVGSVAYYVSEKGIVVSGDTLLAGRMGTVGGDYIDYTTQLASIGEVLLSLPPETRILPDSERETTVGAEAKNFDTWLSMD
ncbi:glyoxylase-like metal-dependent hydrolase (beta-lactamase superfamily II) [Murinocardiopsis flavida]|uniref:Glyoxylase-like metal-dependent hydrolase (Beta-lactamase superfamily II) n=1 Tax=Murinocardiopsis flavida TaxID=645275 RepID=A0A2P8DJI4_9ACTN|nr:MBL fold metallo-hydrolase [Murinocardiopsis flavida]PSK97361.1 glyoxylase-like metal-dependent hydrolase (beta-lactamase superfamily II) [Murinocardiopsis flavida]